MVVEDPAAVAAREVKRNKTERNVVIVLGVGIGVAALVYANNFIRDTREAMELANRPRKPWDL